MPVQPAASITTAIDAQLSAPSTAQVLAAVQASLDGLLDGYPLSLADWKGLPENLKFHFGHVVDQTSACIALRQQVEHIQDALCPYPLLHNPVLHTAVTLFSLFRLEKMPDGALLIEEYLNRRLELAHQDLQEREQWLAEAIDDLCTEVKAMHSPFHAAAQAAAACADDLSQAPYLSPAAASDPAVLDGREPAAGHDAGAPAPPDLWSVAEAALVGCAPPSL